MPENIVVSYKAYIIIKSSYHTAGALSYMCEMYYATKIYTLVFIAVLFITVPHFKQPE